MVPFPITQINDNGTVRFQKGIINDATNIRRIKPFFDWTAKAFLQHTCFSSPKWKWHGSLPKGNHQWCHQYLHNKIILRLNNKKIFYNNICFSLKNTTMARFTLNKESSIITLITHQWLHINISYFNFYDLPHPNHRGECSIPCILQLLEVAP